MGKEREKRESMQIWQIINEGMYKFCVILSMMRYVKESENINLGEICPTQVAPLPACAKI